MRCIVYVTFQAFRVLFSTFLENKFSSQCHTLNLLDTVQTDRSGAVSTRKMKTICVLNENTKKLRTT